MINRYIIFFVFAFLLYSWSTSYSQEATNFSVQVGACLKQKSAESIISQLKRKGYTPYLHQKRDVHSRTWFIVLLGDYPDLDLATSAMAEFKQREKLPALITSVKREKIIEKTQEKALQKTQEKIIEKTQPNEKKKDDEHIDVGIDTDIEESSCIIKMQNQLELLQDEIQQLREQAEVRKKLETTEDEKSKKEKEILEAAGSEYRLLKKGIFGLEYNFKYSYYSYDLITAATEVEHRANHTLENSILVEYSILDNLTFNIDLPFIYKYDQLGTTVSKELTEIGDISSGLQYQPVKTGKMAPTVITFTNILFPSGRSPYKINPEKELASGNGYYAISMGMSLSKTIDPLVVFGNLSYTYNVTIDGLNQKRPSGDRTLEKVDPGDIFGFSIGMGYAMSYNASLNFAYQYNYRLENRYYWHGADSSTSGSSPSSLFSIGSRWQLGSKQSIYFKLDMGLTDDDADFIFSLRIPFEFKN